MNVVKYCIKCLMPDTRPGIKFVDGVCIACINYEKKESTDWVKRRKEFELLCEKHRGCNGNGYDCAIAVSGGKDSHFQVYYMKEVMKMNPLLLSVGNIDWTDTGRKNLENISERFGCDMIMLNPNRRVAKILFKKAFDKLGSPSWYMDYLLYSYPVKMSIKMGIKLLVYGEDVNYTYGGKYDEETPSALMQPYNDVAKQIWKEWFEDDEITEKDLDSIKQPSLKECKEFGLEPIYMSYYLNWDSYHNYQVAKKLGFVDLQHEYVREGSLDNHDQIDSISYLLNPYMKYLKFGHSTATDIGSRWIRSGRKTRAEMIPLVEEFDNRLDQGTIEKFCDFIKMDIQEFWHIMDKWYNKELFEQDIDGLWHPKFKVGTGIIK